MSRRALLVLPVLAALAGAPGCRKPEASIDLNPLDSLPPAAEKAIQKGDLALWAMAFPDGKIMFYMVPPKGLQPVILQPHLGPEALPVRWKQERGVPLYSWPLVLGDRMRNRVFSEPLVIELSYAASVAPRRLLIRGLGEPTPFLNVCFFDLTWEERTS
jgi:hypothetical protein